MIPANAIVDVIQQADVGLSKFRVEVWGRIPYDYVRIYEILAKDQDDAAREGLYKFDVEITALVQEGAA